MKKKESPIVSLLITEHGIGKKARAEIISEEDNFAVKLEMALELKAMGLSDKAISRQLNIDYHRR